MSTSSKIPETISKGDQAPPMRMPRRLYRWKNLGRSLEIVTVTSQVVAAKPTVITRISPLEGGKSTTTPGVLR